MKKVGTCLYVHKSALNQIYEYLEKRNVVEEINRIKNIIEKYNKLDYEIFKYDYKSKKISLIESKDWNISHEPEVGNSLCIHINGEEKKIKASGKIYHGKHFFINKDYIYFSYEKEKERYKEWNEKIPNIKEHKSKIGNKSYWEKLLKENNLEY